MGKAGFFSASGLSTHNSNWASTSCMLFYYCRTMQRILRICLRMLILHEQEILLKSKHYFRVIFRCIAMSSTKYKSFSQRSHHFIMYSKPLHRNSYLFTILSLHVKSRMEESCKNSSYGMVWWSHHMSIVQWKKWYYFFTLLQEINIQNFFL